MQMIKLANNVNGGGAKSALNIANYNSYDQIKFWPVVLRTQIRCM